MMTFSGWKNTFAALLSAFFSLSAFAEQAVAAPPKVDRGFKIEVKADGVEKKVSFKAGDLYKHAAYLASDECEGRFPGTPGHLRARQYIIDELQNIGFKEVRRFPFDFVASVELGTKTSLLAVFDDSVKIDAPGWYHLPSKREDGRHASGYKLDDDFRPLRISESANLTDAPLVFAGYGISAPQFGYDDYKDLDVKGKIVLVLANEPESKDGKTIADLAAQSNPHAPVPPVDEKHKLDPSVNPVAKPDQPNAAAPGSPAAPANPHKAPSIYGNFFYKASTARDKGAAGVILVRGPRGTSDADRATLESFERGFGGRTGCGLPIIHVFAEVADDLLKPSGRTLADAQKLIEEQFNNRLNVKDAPPAAATSFAINGVKLLLQTDVKRPRAEDQNLAVLIPGTDPALKDELVVIGAHYDHLGRGNEFSLAGKNELGQIHYGADDNASGSSSVIELARALHKNRKHLKRTVWLMWYGAEELGTLGSIDFLKHAPEDFKTSNVAAMLNLDMVGRAKDKKVMIYGVGTGTGFEALVKAANDGLGLDLKPSADGFGGSDQTAFVNAGVPVLFFFTGSHEDYHRPSDTVDKLNVSDQALISALVYKSAVQIINAPERPKFIKLEAPKMGLGIGRVRLGTMPDYSFEGKGLRITGVRGGTAADKAGIKGGDVIVNLGGKRVDNIQDYMIALNALTPALETTVTILRDGKEVELKVTPDKP